MLKNSSEACHQWQFLEKLLNGISKNLQNCLTSSLALINRNSRDRLNSLNDFTIHRRRLCWKIDFFYFNCVITQWNCFKKRVPWYEKYNNKKFETHFHNRTYKYLQRTRNTFKKIVIIFFISLNFFLVISWNWNVLEDTSLLSLLEILKTL